MQGRVVRRRTLAPGDARNMFLLDSRIFSEDGTTRDPRPVPDRRRRTLILRRLFGFARRHHWNHGLDESTFRTGVPTSRDVLSVFRFLLRFYDPHFELEYLPFNPPSPSRRARARDGRTRTRPPRIDPSYVFSCVSLLGFEGRLQEKDFRGFDLNTYSHCLLTIECLLNDIEENLRLLQPEIQRAFDATVACAAGDLGSSSGGEDPAAAAAPGPDGHSDDTPMDTSGDSEPQTITVQALAEFPVELTQVSRPAVVGREFFFVENSYRQYMDGDDDAREYAIDARNGYLDSLIPRTQARIDQMKQTLADFERVKTSKEQQEAELRRIRSETKVVRSEIGELKGQIETREVSSRETAEQLQKLKSALVMAEGENENLLTDAEKLRQRVDYQERSVDEIASLKQTQLELKRELQQLRDDSSEQDALKTSLKKQLVDIRRHVELFIPKYNALVAREAGTSVDWKVTPEQLGDFGNVEVWRSILSAQQEECRRLDATLGDEEIPSDEQLGSESDLAALREELEENERLRKREQQSLEENDRRRQLELQEMMDLVAETTKKVRSHVHKTTLRSRELIQATKDWRDQA